MDTSGHARTPTLQAKRRLNPDDSRAQDIGTLNAKELAGDPHSRAHRQGRRRHGCRSSAKTARDGADPPPGQRQFFAKLMALFFIVEPNIF
jgi:hypothetical protein